MIVYQANVEIGRAIVNLAVFQAHCQATITARDLEAIRLAWREKNKK